MIIFKPHQALEILKDFLPQNPIIVEAGAFNGNDTRKMALQWPQGIVHAFEPLGQVYEQLLHNTAQHTNIHCYNVALSDKNGSSLFYISEKKQRPGIASQASSLLKPTETLLSSFIFPHTTMVETITLPSWMQKNNIETIDLLWLDTQGHELAILQAAQSVLPTIKVLFVEVSFVKRYDQQPSYDTVITWLQNNGFTYAGRDFVDMTMSSFGNVLFIQNNVMQYDT